MNIRPKDRDALIQALRAGVVPNVGQHLIQVGRSNEIESLLKDLERVAVGGTAFRLIIGEYGSGKTFFLNLIRSIGLEKKLVATSADLNPDRRLHGSGGQARSLYAELAKNLSDQVQAGRRCACRNRREVYLYSRRRCEDQKRGGRCRHP